MADWSAYRPADFLLFAPRTYWRLFELHNEALWPLQILALLLGAGLLYALLRPAWWSGRAVAAGLAAAWAATAWAFFWQRYATINWAATYVAPVFLLQTLLLLWFGVIRNRFTFARRGAWPAVVGGALCLYAIALHPLMVLVAGRPLRAAEVFALTPDPTVIATLGLLVLLSPRRLAWLLMVIPCIWCLASWVTLDTMQAREAWIPLLAAGIALAGRLLPRAPLRR